MKNNVTDALNEVFAIEGELLDKPKNIIVPEIPKEATEDFEVARQNIHGIIKKSSEALDYLLEVAKASEHPRAFEVVSQLTKTLVDANKDLLELQKKIKELKTEEKQNDLKQNVTNALFVGSTSELQKFLRGHSEEK
jgi:predicted DNA-binding protein YlxM (UPF0122 family)